MKLLRLVFSVFAPLLFLVVIFVLVSRWINVSQQKSAGQLSVIAQEEAKKPKNKIVTSQQVASQPIFIKPPSSFCQAAPLDHLSDEELAEFPGACVVDAIEVPGPEANQTICVRILNTNFKYPNIRTEEVIDHDSGGLIRREEMIADHLLVSLNNGEDPQSFLKKCASFAISIVPVSPGVPLYRLQLKSSALDALPQALDAIAVAGVTSVQVEPDFMGHTSIIPNDPAVQWYSSFRYWTQLPFFSKYTNAYEWGLFKIDAPQAWSVRNSAASIVVAVIDSGIRYTHEDLKANMWTNPSPTKDDLHGWNAYDNNGDPMDKYGHGTFCAGIIGGVGNNGIGITGISWKIQLMACRCTDDNGTIVTSDMINCIDYACDHGAKILNCSFDTPSYSQNAFNAIQRAHQKGVIVVTAAGNAKAGGRATNNEEIPMYPGCYILDNIMSVAATDWNDELADFSNYGPRKVQIAAPGANIYSTWGGASTNIDIINVVGSGDSCYGTGNGTSASTPFVTGALALMMAQFPNDSYRLLMDKLLAAADKIPSLNGKVGYGRLNLARALKTPPTAVQ